MFITEQTKRVASECSWRYSVINEKGEFADRNEYGKAVGYAFQSKAAAVRTAKRQGLAVWDKLAGAFL